ncbi:hypothetical protein AHAS_Ahas20G0090000 [Arachis hypogaea]
MMGTGSCNHGLDHAAVGRVRLLQGMGSAPGDPSAPLGRASVVELHGRHREKGEGRAGRVLDAAGDEARSHV